jgi:hypothetical protein
MAQRKERLLVEQKSRGRRFLFRDRHNEEMEKCLAMKSGSLGASGRIAFPQGFPIRTTM